MTHRRAGVPYFIAALALFSLAAVSAAEAREKLTYVQGMQQCTAWCAAHNTTSASRIKCNSRCDTYWVHNASDGQQYLVEGM